MGRSLQAPSGAADFWRRGIDKGRGNMVYYALFYAREERE